MKRYWKEQIELYPDMQIQDFVKFLYQANLGPAHLIENQTVNYQYLVKEYDSIKKDDTHILIEEISDEYVRVHLEALSNDILDRFHQLFVRSAEVKDTNDTFIDELSLAEKEIIAGNLPFDVNEWKQYMITYRDLGYPMVSHSESFRQQYHPHYRLIKKLYVGELYDNKK